MATITGYTAARMQEIEDQAIVGGTIVGDDLVLNRFDGGTVNAGNVRGATGPMNPDGNPAGTLIMGGWTTNFTGYLLLNGQTVVGGVAANPTVAAMYPSWVNGADLDLPETLGVVPMGVASGMGDVAGSMTHTLTTANVPAHTHSVNAHTHTINHDHGSASTLSGGSHSHSASGSVDNGSMSHTHASAAANGEFITRDTAYNNGFAIPWNTAAIGGVSPVAVTWIASTTPNNITHSHTYSLTTSTHTGHAHSFDMPGFTGNSGSSGSTTDNGNGSGTAVDHTPKHIGVRFAVKTG